MFAWYRRRWLDLVGSIYIYNEHRGYTALDRVLEAVRNQFPDDRAFIAEIEQHRADEHKHYLMFKRWWQKRGLKPFFVDRACGHIDRFVEIMFGSRIDDLDAGELIKQEQNFAKMCRVIALTERRGYRQVEILLQHPAVRQDRSLMKMFQIIQEDEPSHWAPYEKWLSRRRQRDPRWWERAIDHFIHSELLMLKLPVLFLTPGLRRRSEWPDAMDADLPGAQCVATIADTTAARKVAAAAMLMTAAAAEAISFAEPMAES